MFLVYLDDSGSESSDYQLMGAVILKELEFRTIEEYLALTIESLVPEELRDKFEFHASAMLNGKEPFENLGRDKALNILDHCVRMVRDAPITVVYGGVKLRALRGSVYATASPVDVAFRMCLQGIEKWFAANEQSRSADEIGLLIADEPGKNQKPKESLQKAFRAYRRRLKWPSLSGGTTPIEQMATGLQKYIHDDMYFGDSAYSVGIQLADICTYIVLRHLEGKQDTEFLYQTIRNQIFAGEVV